MSRDPVSSPNRLGAKILDGVKVAKSIRLGLKLEVEKWVASGQRPPKLVAVLVGNDSASTIYVRNKMRAANEIGIHSTTLHFPTTISQTHLIKEIDCLNVDSEIDGIIVQLPLPGHIAVREVSNAVLPEKDVDGFNVVNIGKLCLNMKGFVPCTVLGIQELIRESGIETRGINAVICGRSKNLGLPIAMFLHGNRMTSQGMAVGLDASTTICHRNTPPERLSEHLRRADLIISATGVPNLIKADMVKRGACVIDVGISRIIDKETGAKRIVGDVDYEAVREVAGFITPVPGGVGPMTVAMLMKNTLQAAKIRFNSVNRDLCGLEKRTNIF